MDSKFRVSVFLALAVVILVQGKDELEETLLQIATASNTFGMELHRTMTQTSVQNKNTFFSPLSIYSAFAMVSAGARKSSSDQLQKVLNWDSFSTPKDLLTGHQKLKLFLKSAFYSSTDNPIKFANKLWIQKHFCISSCKSYVKLLQENYYSELGISQFVKRPEEARLTINKWVAKKTANKIPELLEPGTVRSTTRLVLTNAVYFKRNWKYQFDKAATTSLPFHVSKDNSVQANMMKMTSEIGYTQDASNQVLELPYTTDSISMVVILPKDIEGITKLEKSLDDAMLRQYLQSLRKKKVEISMPKFKLSSDMHLKDYLSLMGVRDIFDPFLADLSGMTGYKGLFITHAIHQGFVDVSEEGTEAAAATGVTAGFRSLVPNIFRFNANHPFMFAIIHKPTNGVLFLGKIVDPTNEKSSPHSN